MSQYFPPYRNSGESVKFELDLSSDAAETDLKNVTYIGIINLALKSNLQPFTKYLRQTLFFM